MVDIHSVTAEIRRGIKKKKKQDKNIMSASATQGGHNKQPFHYWEDRIPNYYLQWLLMTPNATSKNLLRNMLS